MQCRLVLGTVLLPLLVGGCGSSPDAAVSRVADDFEAAVSGGDAEAACRLLAASTLDELEQSSGRPCAESILDEVAAGGQRAAVARYGTAAQATYRDDVLFLTEGPSGWRVLAAGCTPGPGSAPYDCGISGG
jgi:hypothetical protein